MKESEDLIGNAFHIRIRLLIEVSEKAIFLLVLIDFGSTKN